MSTDKRDECECHRGCYGDLWQGQHPCTNPCRWPDCLTETEQAQLVDEIVREGL
jgi:hypothetical protein